MARNSYRKLLTDLRPLLGGEWSSLSASLIYRSGGPFLIQCVSGDTSRFSRDFVLATFVQVLPHPSEHFAYDFGGRLKLADGHDGWLSGEVEASAEAILPLIQEQARPDVRAPLTMESVERELDRRPIPKGEIHYAWCAGLVYGLRGREKDARRCIDVAKNGALKLRAAWLKQRMPADNWVSAALREMSVLEETLADPERFEAHCHDIAAQTRVHLKLKI
jgi:hypothetical protein